MAATKKTTAAKEETAKVADTKTDEVKTVKEAPAAKTETVTTATKKPGRKPAAEKAPAKKPGRKPAAEKKAPAKKETVKKETVKKEPAAKKAEVKEAVHIQFGGKSYASEDLIKIAKDVWVYDLNQEEKNFKSVELYVKPEENAVYYVINGEVQGSFNI